MADEVSGEVRFPFPEEVQKRILIRLCRDRAFLMGPGKYLRPSYFHGNAYFQILCSVVTKFWMEFRSIPDSLYMGNILSDYLMKDKRLDVTIFQELLQEIYTTPIDAEDKYLTKQTTDFVKTQEILFAHKESQRLVLESSDFDKARAVVLRAYSVGTGDTLKIVDHKLDLRDRMQRLVQPRKCVPVIVIPRLDEITDGGTGSGELMIIVASTGRGKTLFLVNFVRGALIKGKKILYITLEVSAEIIAQRLDSSLTSKSRAQLRKDPNPAIVEIDSFYGRFGGQLKVAEFLAGKATVADIEYLVNNLIVQDGFHPDKIIVDYADLLKSASTRSERRHELSDIYTDLRALGRMFDVPVDTASQSNRVGFNVEVVGLEHIAEDIGKVTIADVVYTLSQTKAEAEKEGLVESMRIWVGKNRNNPAGMIIPVSVNKYTMQVFPREIAPPKTSVDDVKKSILLIS